MKVFLILNEYLGRPGHVLLDCEGGNNLHFCASSRVELVKALVWNGRRVELVLFALKFSLQCCSFNAFTYALVGAQLWKLQIHVGILEYLLLLRGKRVRLPRSAQNGRLGGLGILLSALVVLVHIRGGWRHVTASCYLASLVDLGEKFLLNFLVLHVLLEGSGRWWRFDASWTLFVVMDLWACEGVIVFWVQGAVLHHRLMLWLTYLLVADLDQLLPAEFLVRGCLYSLLRLVLDNRVSKGTHLNRKLRMLMLETVIKL